MHRFALLLLAGLLPGLLALARAEKEVEHIKWILATAIEAVLALVA